MPTLLGSQVGNIYKSSSGGCTLETQIFVHSALTCSACMCHVQDAKQIAISFSAWVKLFK